MSRINKISEWFHAAESWKQFWLLIGAILVFKGIWTFSIGWMLFGFDSGGAQVEAPEGDAEPSSGVDKISVEDVVVMGKVFFGFMLGEEFLFRFVPITAGLALMSVWRPLGWLLVPIVLVFSMIFGIIHAPNHESIDEKVILSTLLLQGFGGLIYSLLFLKVTRFQISRVFHGFVATVFTHTLWNVLVTLTMISFAAFTGAR